jgi:hypothetical protein
MSVLCVPFLILDTISLIFLEWIGITNKFINKLENIMIAIWCVMGISFSLGILMLFLSAGLSFIMKA